MHSPSRPAPARSDARWGSLMEALISKPVTIWTRGARYVSTFWWLLRNQVASGPLLMAGAIMAGVMKRLGDVVVMIATVKCISWLVRPETMPHALLKVLPFAPRSWAFDAILLAIPASLVIAAALGGLIYEKFLTTLVTRCAERIAILELRAKMNTLAQMQIDYTPVGRTVKGVVDRFTLSQEKLGRTLRIFMSLLVATATLAMTIAIGSVIQPLITAVVALGGVVTIALMIWNRHEKGSTLNTRTQSLRDRSAERAETLRKMLMDTTLDAKGQTAVIELIADQRKDVLADNRDRDRQSHQSRTTMDVAQAALVLLFMGSLLFVPTEFNAHDIAMLMILVLLMRLAMAQIRSVSNYALQLSNDYSQLVEYRSLETMR